MQINKKNKAIVLIGCQEQAQKIENFLSLPENSIVLIDPMNWGMTEEEQERAIKEGKQACLRRSESTLKSKEELTEELNTLSKSLDVRGVWVAPYALTKFNLEALKEEFSTNFQIKELGNIKSQKDSRVEKLKNLFDETFLDTAAAA